MERNHPELQKFLKSFIYSENAFYIDRVLKMDPEKKEIEGLVRTDREWPIGREQRGDPKLHPRHVSGPELILMTGNLGCLHAYFFHQCRWDEGWVGFGNRIHRADFKRLAQIGPDLLLRSRETRTRVGASRVMMRFDFEFTQDGKVVYSGDQSAMFFKGASFDEGDAEG
ncbi:MAG: hypothetical protein ACXWP5_03245 [Bdellovibrionota bacterium]